MKVLVANRGEIAIRILRTCRELGMPSVAIYSDADQEALHTRYADEAVLIGPASPAQSYLNIAAILRAARMTGAQAIHPGYGFLSENADFCREVEEAGLLFIGPSPETLALSGDKLAARKAARDAGLPVLPGADLPLSEETQVGLVEQINFPVLVKAISGGGGRGIRLAHSREELDEMVVNARQEALAAFGDDAVYLEPLVQNARHIEVQILADGRGHVLCLGERECSIQRRRQKLIEEAPACGLSPTLRNQLFDYATRVARRIAYRSLGTVEFLIDPQGGVYFIEINPRIQVEHPVTEMVTGLDLVQAQLQLAVDGSLALTQAEVRSHGWAIEARILAEDPSQGFMPATGAVMHLQEPGGPGIRVDSALFLGMPVTANYDSLLAKVIAWGKDRPAAISRLHRSLQEFQIGGVPTDLEFLSQVIESPAFVAGRVDTTFLDTFQPPVQANEDSVNREVALATALATHQSRAPNQARPDAGLNAWQSAAWREQMHH
ncbi:MAG: biotin carboxylase N-terminal domain-containing protein [Anaerolineaceae bacterium]|nr:biotin carboxylase N-terminal domain-containing protein [Anaerolineaceae bacterium]